jgi:RNA polymerase sigma factor (sigma-70 family)
VTPVGPRERHWEVRREIERVYREQGARMWRAVWLATGSSEVASDAVAEAFAQALRRGERLRDPARWAWRAAFKIAEAEMQERRRLTELVDAPYEVPEPLIDLARALSTLSPHQRTAFVLSEYGGYRHREIARMLSSSVSAVGVHIFRARRRLRDLLEDTDA